MTATRTEPRHQPPWSDLDSLHEVTSKLLGYRGLIDPGVSAQLRRELAEVARGKAFVIQAGDCAERFAETSRSHVFAKARMLDRIADAAEEILAKPVIRIGRLGGQFAKPRSKATERLPDGSEALTYRGDAVNDTAPTVLARVADPRRIALAYEHSASVVNTLGLSPSRHTAAARTGAFSLTYSAHEALLLDYERALVRTDPISRRRYATSAHFLWVGERTRRINDAHVEFVAGVANPIGVKIGPSASPTEVRALVNRLGPDRLPGRLTLIVRMGRERVGEALPRVLSHYGLHPGGLHLESTPVNVTECVDSTAELDRDLSENYATGCDSRLNPRQADYVVQRAAHLFFRPSGHEVVTS
ncbi:MAG: 3-deoxy-7-phosphoheptulonate synthase [Pseudonocardia sp.]|nr:3-deoxy-7-phosphoheptulonate synthase [Pseudonocardia sp.]